MSRIEVGAARKYAEQILGGPVAEKESNPAVAASYTTLAQGSGDRVALVIVNTGANDIMVGTSSGISSTNGIRLGANGGSLTMSVDKDFTLPSREWGGIGIGGTSTAYVLELSRYDTRPQEFAQ